MIPPSQHSLVLALYPQSHGFSFALFEAWPSPLDWGFHEVRGLHRNVKCLRRIASIFALHTPDFVALQGMSDGGARRAPRIQELNRLIAELAEGEGIPVRSYSRTQVLEYFEHRGATTKQQIAETIAQKVPALALQLPPPRKPYKSEDDRMGIFEAAALAWMFFHDLGGSRNLA